jgi:hypothetical protein
MASEVGCTELSLGTVAEICDIVQARKFLPYAHWWGEIGAPPDLEERILTEQLRSSLAELGATTEILSWCIGDSYVPTSEQEGVVIKLQPH